VSSYVAANEGTNVLGRVVDVVVEDVCQHIDRGHGGLGSTILCRETKRYIKI